jgi:hypothetical protein
MASEEFQWDPSEGITDYVYALMGADDAAVFYTGDFPHLSRADADLIVAAVNATASEPAAIVESWTNGSYHRNYRIKWLKDVPEGTKLYDVPKVAQPLADASQPEGIEGQIRHLVTCVREDVLAHDGKLAARSQLAEERLKVLISLAVKNATAPKPFNEKAERAAFLAWVDAYIAEHGQNPAPEDVWMACAAQERKP